MLEQLMQLLSLRRRFGKLLAEFLGLAIFASIAGGPSVFASDSSVSLSELVDQYEEHATFRGTANGVLPARLDYGLKLGVLLVKPGSSDAGLKRHGFVDFGETVKGTHIIAASDGVGMDRFGIVIEKATADTQRFIFDVSLPEGAEIENSESGAVHVRSPHGDTTLAPALAIDSTGKQLPAKYRIVGNELVIDVELHNATLPVLVDPVSSSYWWGTTTWYSRADVRWQADWYSVIRVAQVACNGMPGWAKGPCSKTVGRYTSWIYNTWQYAKNNNQCLSMSMTWTGQVTAINAYVCNWG